MKEHIDKSIICTSIMFIALMVYTIICMMSRFSYLDLCYLVVVVIYFVLYLRLVKKA